MRSFFIILPYILQKLTYCITHPTNAPGLISALIPKGCHIARRETS